MKKNKLKKRIKILEQKVWDLELGQNSANFWIVDLIKAVDTLLQENHVIVSDTPDEIHPDTMTPYEAVEPVAKKISREEDINAPDPDLLGEYDGDCRGL